MCRLWIRRLVVVASMAAVSDPTTVTVVVRSGPAVVRAELMADGRLDVSAGVGRLEPWDLTPSQHQEVLSLMLRLASLSQQEVRT